MARTHPTTARAPAFGRVRVRGVPQAVPPSGTVVQEASLTEASLWDPPAEIWHESWLVRAPAMYSLTTSLVDPTGRIIDTVTTKFGIRQLIFDPDLGLLVNGRGVKAKGMCNHQDFAGVGVYLCGARASSARACPDLALPKGWAHR